MASRIKGITIEIGGDVTGLDKALESTNKSLKNTQSQLKDVERLLKLDPKNIQLLAQQQRLLAEAVEETEQKLETLKDAEKQVQQQFERGEVSREQYEALQREISSTAIDLRKLEDKAEDAVKQLNKIDEDPVEDVTQAAKKAEKAMDDAADSAFDFGDALTAGALIEGVKGIAGAISDLNEETKEYRKIMASLETSSQSAGYTAQETEQTYKQLFGVLGDDQTAATTTANLQALNLEQRELINLTDATIGAWAKYGDSIPIDGLAESVNETVKAGQVTGTFADVLNWGSKEGETFGVTLRANTKANKEWNDAVLAATSAEDFFNLALQSCNSEAERANLVYQAMASQGLASMGRAWQQNNKDIVDANLAQADFMDKTAELAERLSPLMLAVQEGVNGLLDILLDLTENIDMDSVAETISSLFDVLYSLITFLIDNHEIVLSILAGIAAGWAALKIVSIIQQITTATSVISGLISVFPALGSVIGLLTNPIFAVVAAVTFLVAHIATSGDEMQANLQKLDDWLQNIFAKDWTEVFGPVLGGILNGFMGTVKEIWDSIKMIFDGVIDFIRGVFTGDWERAWNGVMQIFGGLFSKLQTYVKGPLNGVIALLNGAILGINTLIGGLNNLSFTLPSWLGGGSLSINLPTISSIPYLAKGGTLFEGSAVVGEAGPELLTVGNGRAVVQPLPGNTGRIESLLGDISGQLGSESSTPIVVQVTLDGKVIGETALNYSRRRARASGN